MRDLIPSCLFPSGASVNRGWFELEPELHLGTVMSPVMVIRTVRKRGNYDVLL